MKLHFIAIGGSVMHNLALELHANGHTVSGSDDVIHSPSYERLEQAELLPPTEGWHPERITSELDAVLLGMHAKADNPELLRARELGLPIHSFPEFIRHQTQDKQRIVVAGSHGKTSITAMILHALRRENRDFDYLVGAQLPDFQRMVRLSETAPIAVLEGDEYPSSPLDRQAKFMHYEPHILVLTGIAWDHINVYPDEQSYVQAFSDLLKSLPKAAVCIYNKEDKRLRELVKAHLDEESHYAIPYSTPSYKIRNEEVWAKLDGHQKTRVHVYGKHNMANLAAAREVLCQLSVPEEHIAEHLGSFDGAHFRLQEVYRDEQTIVIRDWAHAPSKVAASLEAVRERYKERKLIPVLELHTFSSLNSAFLPEYANVFSKQKHAYIYIDPDTLTRKGSDALSEAALQQAFNHTKLKLISGRDELERRLRQEKSGRDVFLMMTSGNFSGLELADLGR